MSDGIDRAKGRYNYNGKQHTYETKREKEEDRFKLFFPDGCERNFKEEDELNETWTGIQKQPPKD